MPAPRATVAAMRPLVGITAFVEQARWRVWDKPAVMLPYAYVRHVEDAGGRAVLVPPFRGDPGEIVDRVDALVLSGGPDIDPARYGVPPHPLTADVRPERDEAELGLIAAARARDLPVLGICRGMQLLTVAHGGSLHQHLPDILGHDRHLPATGVYGEHSVRISPGSVVHEIIGDAAVVPSYHHQGIATPGSLTACGWAEDGSIEAVEAPIRRFLVGVMWHPEAGTDGRLFQALVTAAR